MSSRDDRRTQRPISLSHENLINAVELHLDAVPFVVRQDAAPPLGDDGFAPASLLSVFAYPQTFLHNGRLTSLDEVLENVAHRSAGTGSDTLVAASDRAKVVKFLLSIDEATPPIPIP